MQTVVILEVDFKLNLQMGSQQVLTLRFHGMPPFSRKMIEGNIALFVAVPSLRGPLC